MKAIFFIVSIIASSNLFAVINAVSGGQQGYSDGSAGTNIASSGTMVSTPVAPSWSGYEDCADAVVGNTCACDLSSFISGNWTPICQTTATSGSFPAGCTLATDCTFSGTYSSASAYSFTVTAENNEGAAVSATVNQTVSSAPGGGDGNYAVAWESNFNIPSQDANGFSVLTPSSDSRIMYVSATGNDGTGTVYEYGTDFPGLGSDYQNPTGSIQPYLTIQAAVNQMRAGYPDYVLLKRGDTFTDQRVYLLNKNGRSATERSVVTWYGTATERPYVKTSGTNSGITIYNSYIAVVGLRFEAYERNPSDPDFVGFGSVQSALNIFMQHGGTSDSVLIEDCDFQWYANGSIQMLNAAGSIEDLIFRRNIVANNYAVGSHGQGMFLYNTAALFEENLFYHNGWYCQAGGAGCSGAEATIFNHNIYLTAPYNSILRKNIFISPSSINMKFAQYDLDGQGTTVGNLLIDNNLMIDAEVGISIAKDNTANDWNNFLVTNNVMQLNGTSNPTNRSVAWGIDYTNVSTGIITGNIMSMTEASRTNTRGMWFQNLLTNATITNNKFYQPHGTSVSFAMITAILLSTSSGNTFSGNELIATNASVLLNMDSESGFTIDSNTYYSTASPQSNWFDDAATGGTNATYVAPSYTDPDRTIFDYMTANYSTAATTAAIFAKFAEQSAVDWDANLTANVINDYIRLGLE